MSEITARRVGMDGAAKGSATLPEELFGQPKRQHLIWLAVKRHLGNQRHGTASVKTRGDVSGGGKKPFRQKGTGRARQGSNTSPLMPGGGRAFGPKPRDHRTDMPKKQRRAALCSVLSIKASAEAVMVIDSLKLTAPKTSEIAKLLKQLGLQDKRTLLVLGESDPNVVKSCRNVKNLTTTLAAQLNPYDLLHADTLLFTDGGLEKVKEVFVR